MYNLLLSFDVGEWCESATDSLNYSVWICAYTFGYLIHDGEATSVLAIKAE